MEMADGLEQPQRFWGALTIWLGLTLAVLDGAIANVALPAIARDVHAAPAAAVWVVNAYQLAVTISLLPLSALGERHGYRRVYWAGLSVFIVASAACALSRTLPALTLARVLQGFGAAGIMSVNGALVRFIYPRRLMGQGLGLNSMVASVSAALGPTVAAGILSIAHWQWLFAINVPLGVLALIIALRTLPATPRSAQKFDVASAALNALTFGLLIVGIDGAAHGQGRLVIAGELLGAVVCGAVLIARQLSETAPLLPVDLLRIPLFGLSVATSITTFAAQSLAFVSLPFLFENGFHLSDAHTGLLMTPWPVAVAVIAPFAGRLADRYPAGLLGGIGLAGMTVGLALLTLLPSHPALPAIIAPMALCGLGFGFFNSPNNRAMLTAAPRERSGGASGMLATARLLGQTTGAALVALCFAFAHARGPKLALALATGAAVAATIASLSRLGGAARAGADS